jgi:hypothetical protein
MCQLLGFITCRMQLDWKLDSNEIQMNSTLLILICDFGNQ